MKRPEGKQDRGMGCQGEEMSEDERVKVKEMGSQEQGTQRKEKKDELD